MLMPLHKVITVAALVTGALRFIFFYNLIRSYLRGSPAPANPWEATMLEWTTTSPPPPDNYASPAVIVYRDSYQYEANGSGCDHVMHNVPPELGREHRSRHDQRCEFAIAAGSCQEPSLQE